MAITNAGKAIVLDAIDDAVLGMAILDNTDTIIQSKTVAGQFSFTSSSSGMVLASSVVFDIPAGTIVLSVKLYNNTDPTQGTVLDVGLLPGTTAERTFTYAGTYTLTGYTITAA